MDAFEITNLRQLLNLQQKAEWSEHMEIISLDIVERCLRGYAISELEPHGKTDEGHWLLTCPENLSRFQPGDEVLLVSDTDQISATLMNVSHDSIVVNKPVPQLKQRCVAERVYTDYTKLVQESISALENRNLPLFHILARHTKNRSTGLGIDDPSITLRQLEKDSGMKLDDVQKRVFCSAVDFPMLWAMQGPPGTGKTQVAVLIAEAFSREPDMRVLLVSLSHAAVNNLLSTIKSTFPNRTVVKVGGDQANENGVEHIKMRELSAHRKNKQSAIFGMTAHAALTMTTSSHLRDYHPEVVIADEAGQVPLAVGAGLTSIGASLLLLADKEQLAPIFPEQVRDHPLACSVLQWFVAKHPYERLITTHRLNTELSGKIGLVFYRSDDGTSGLKSSQAAANRKFSSCELLIDWVNDALSPRDAMVWVQTSQVGTHHESASEADAISHLVKAVVTSGMSTEEIAILTPFRKQVNRLRIRLQEELTDVPFISTVESMQGQSVELAIISLAAADPSFLSLIEDFYFRSNRWCVASSRAKTKTIFVGHPIVLNARPSTLEGMDGFLKLRMLLYSAKQIRALC